MHLNFTNHTCTIADGPLFTQFAETFKLSHIKVKTQTEILVIGGSVEVSVELESSFPCRISVKRACLSMEKMTAKDNNSNVSSSIGEKKNGIAQSTVSSSLLLEKTPLTR